jgi:diguanylate cyclase (GGDEF)-like protein
MHTGHAMSYEGPTFELVPIDDAASHARGRVAERGGGNAVAPDVLSERFRRTLAERRRHVHELWQAVRRNFDDRAARSRLARTAYTLGSAAHAYGFDQVGEAARELSQLLGAHPAQALREAPAALDALLATMDAAANAHERTSSWRCGGAPTVWLGPAGAEPLPWLAALLAVGGYRVLPIEQAGAPADEDTAFHLLIGAFAAAGGGEAWLADRIAALSRSGRPVHVIALGDCRDYAQRARLAEIGVDVVLPAQPDKPLLLRVVEGELASRSGARPTVAFLTDPRVSRRDWSEAFEACGIRLRFVATNDELVRLADAHAVDAAVLDLSDPDESVTIARVLRQDEQNIQLPVLALGVAGEPRPALLANGIEGLPSDVAPARVAAIVRDRVSRRRRRVLGARRDALTGLLTRVAFAHAMKSLLEADVPVVAFAIVDLDDFKGINERLGHVGGDRVLRDTAQRITAALPPTGVAGRFGGDEFVLGFGARTELEARSLLAHVAAIGDGRVRDAERARFSLGALLLDRVDRASGVGLDTLTARADALLYQSKAAGKATLSVVSWKESAQLLA